MFLEDGIACNCLIGKQIFYLVYRSRKLFGGYVAVFFVGIIKGYLDNLVKGNTEKCNLLSSTGHLDHTNLAIADGKQILVKSVVSNHSMSWLRKKSCTNKFLFSKYIDDVLIFNMRGPHPFQWQQFFKNISMNDVFDWSTAIKFIRIKDFFEKRNLFMFYIRYSVLH